MVDAIIRDKNKVLPCAAYLTGQYGHEGIFLGVPVKLGRAGIVEVLEIKLTDAETKQLASSADAVKELIETLG